MSRTASVISIIAVATFQLCVSNAFCPAQQPGTQSVVGAVIDIDKNSRSATVKTDNGGVVVVKTDEQTVCLRIPAGEKTLARAVAIQFADIVVGDRVLGHGTKTEKDFLAQRLVVMPKAEIEKKRAHDLDEWRRRGIAGIVKELNAQSGEINLELRGAGAGGRVMITAAQADFRRYTPGSIRFEDAAASRFADLKVGDQLRALGDKSADGRTFKAEEVVSGAFKTIGVTVTEIDLQKNEIKATTLDQKKPVLIVLTKDSMLHRIPPLLAASIAQKALANKRANPGTGGPQPAALTPKTAPTASAPADVQQAIDELPRLTLTDLKVGDVLAITSAIEKDDARLTAIKLVAGVDLVLKAMAPEPGKPQVVRLSAGLPSVFDFSVVQ
jgi:hypothetical protein